MATAKTQDVKNRGICNTCNKVCPAHHERREGQVFLIKECPDCGKTEALVSTDSKRYDEKREMVGYQGEAQRTCSLECTKCSAHKPPTLVFVDVTNRCNMNCPICLANIPAMGFRFDPPIEYFDKIFERLSRIDPKPKIQLFGGEPTVRKDLVDIIRLAKQKYGLSARVVTNGLRLADEEYCKELIATGTELMYSFDGRHVEIYDRMRRHPKAFEKKMKGLENVGKHRKSKVTIMCCVGDVNAEFMADMVDYCHENRHFIAALDLIPLTAEWGPEQVDVQSTTIEGVEDIMARQMPGTEFFPAGMLYQLETLRATFPVGRMTFGGAHPNCEVVSMMVSDGEHYRPVNHYLKRPLGEVMMETVALDKRMGHQLPRSVLGRLFGRRGRQFVYGRNLWRLTRRSADLKAIFGGGVAVKLLKVLWGLIRGKKLKTLLRAHTKCHAILRVIILPFEDKECVESARLVDCPAAFAYEDSKSGDVRLMPVCAWPAYKNPVLKDTTEKYGIDNGTGDLGMEGLKKTGEAKVEE